MDPTPQSTQQPDAETARILAVYHRRDRRGPRHRSIVEAYRLINEDRLARTQAVVTDAFPNTTPAILDVGCGTGFDLAHWLASGWPASALGGVDLVQERILEARAKCPGVDLHVTSGSTLPFGDDSFDVATAVTVFSSILDPEARRELFTEMRRVVRPGGVVLIYDFTVRKPTNRDVIAMDLGRLRELGSPPTRSVRLTPLLQVVALGTRLGSIGTRLSMTLAPRTHRLSWWREPRSDHPKAPGGEPMPERRQD